MIYGAGHLGLYPGYENLRALVETAQPGALFVVMPYLGYASKACAARFERHLKHWKAPALASPVRGSSLEKDIGRPGCAPFDRAPDATQAQYDTASGNANCLTCDALLYLGPRSGFTNSPSNPDLYLDLDFRAEMDRRYRLRTGEPLAGDTQDTNPAIDRPYAIH